MERFIHWVKHDMTRAQGVTLALICTLIPIGFTLWLRAEDKADQAAEKKQAVEKRQADAAIRPEAVGRITTDHHVYRNRSTTDYRVVRATFTVKDVQQKPGRGWGEVTPEYTIRYRHPEDFDKTAKHLTKPILDLTFKAGETGAIGVEIICPQYAGQVWTGDLTAFYITDAAIEPLIFRDLRVTVQGK